MIADQVAIDAVVFERTVASISGVEYNFITEPVLEETGLRKGNETGKE